MTGIFLHPMRIRQRKNLTNNIKDDYHDFSGNIFLELVGNFIKHHMNMQIKGLLNISSDQYLFFFIFARLGLNYWA
jgi:hypothetical protein